MAIFDDSPGAVLIDEWRTAAAAAKRTRWCGPMARVHLFEFKVVEQAESGAVLA